MASNSLAALVGASGVAFTADVGSAAPTALDALPVAYADLGYISQDGMTAAVDEERQSWTPWGALSPIRTQVTSSTKTYAITAWETNRTVLSLYHKVPVTDLAADATTGIVEFGESDKPAPDRRSFVFDIFDGDANRIRIYIPLGEVTERGDVVYKSDDLVGYPMTISAYPGPDGKSVFRTMKLAALT
jgi:hypothetical protein